MVTNSESGLHASSYSGIDAYGVKFLAFYATTTLDIQVSVRIELTKEINVITRLDQYYDENGNEYEDYKKLGFNKLHNARFNLDQFLEFVANRFK